MSDRCSISGRSNPVGLSFFLALSYKIMQKITSDPSTSIRAEIYDVQQELHSIRGIFAETTQRFASFLDQHSKQMNQLEDRLIFLLSQKSDGSDTNQPEEEKTPQTEEHNVETDADPVCSICCVVRIPLLKVKDSETRSPLICQSS